MTAEERVTVIRRGIAMLRAIEAQRRAALPPPDRDTFAQLAAVRDVMALADRLAMHLDIEGSHADAVYARDSGISSALDPCDRALLEARAPLREPGDACGAPDSVLGCQRQPAVSLWR